MHMLSVGIWLDLLQPCYPPSLYKLRCWNISRMEQGSYDTVWAWTDQFCKLSLKSISGRIQVIQPKTSYIA